MTICTASKGLPTPSPQNKQREERENQSQDRLGYLQNHNPYSMTMTCSACYLGILFFFIHLMIPR